MRHVVILAHPKDRSFTRMMAESYIAAVEGRGHTTLLRDLYAMDFEPRLAGDEIPGPDGATPRPDVVAERERIGDADVFCFVYPIWFGGPPAILKGYVERVFGVGFGYRSIKSGGLEPLLKGRKMISLTSSGSANEWLVESGGWDAVRKVFDQRIALSTGLEALDHINYGGVDFDLPPGLVAEARAGIVKAVTELF